MYRILMIMVSVLVVAGVIGYIFMNREITVDAPLPNPPVDVAVNTPVISKENQEYNDVMQVLEEQKREERAQKINDIELANIAITAIDPLQCADIVSETTKKLCMERTQEALAIKENNITACDPILDEGKRKICNDKIYYSQALEKSDTVICDMIDDSGVRNECMFRVEQKIYKGAGTEKSTTGSSRTIDCDEFSNSSITSQCQSDQNTKNDYSLLSESLQSQKSSSCDGIRDDKIQSDCYDGVHFLDAKNSGSIQDCEKIVSATVKSQCIMTVSTLSDSKYFQEAIQTQNIGLCDKITSASLRVSCSDRIRFNYIIQSKNSDDCSLLTDVSLQQVCKNSLGGN